MDYNFPAVAALFLIIMIVIVIVIVFRMGNYTMLYNFWGGGKLMGKAIMFN
jgi:hypothetical protein